MRASTTPFGWHQARGGLDPAQLSAGHTVPEGEGIPPALIHRDFLFRLEPSRGVAALPADFRSSEQERGGNVSYAGGKYRWGVQL